MMLAVARTRTGTNTHTHTWTHPCCRTEDGRRVQAPADSLQWRGLPPSCTHQPGPGNACSVSTARLEIIAMASTLSLSLSLSWLLAPAICASCCFWHHIWQQVLHVLDHPSCLTLLPFNPPQTLNRPLTYFTLWPLCMLAYFHPTYQCAS